MKNVIINLCLIVLISCGTENNESSKIENDLTSLNLKGNVKEYSSNWFEIKSYKFGEPEFEPRFSSNSYFNSFGFSYKYNSTYHSYYDSSKSFSEEFIQFQDSINGLISKRVYEREDYKLVQFYEYDSISKKIVKVKNFNKEDGPPEIKSYDYGDGSTKISTYNETGELKSLVVEKYNESKNPISVIEYDKDGQMLDETYHSYFDDGSKKDSVVNRFSSTKEIWFIHTYLYDDMGRIIKETEYDDGDLDKIKGSYREYDDGNFNSSYDKFVFEGKDGEVVEKLRVSKSYDEIGNVIEEVTTNMENDKIVEKKEYSYKYYSN